MFCFIPVLGSNEVDGSAVNNEEADWDSVEGLNPLSHFGGSGGMIEVEAEDRVPAV